MGRPGLYFQSKSEKNSRDILLHPHLDYLLEMNGLEARIRLNKSGEAVLLVEGMRGLAHSPSFTIPISSQEMATLMNGGMPSSDRRAYETFNRIVKDKFIPPKSMEYAQIGIGKRGKNNQTLVNMGGNGVLTDRGWRSQNIDGRPIPGQMSAEREVGGQKVPTAGYIYKGNLTSSLQQQTAQNIKMEIVEDKPKSAERPAEGLAKKLDSTTKSAGNDTFLQLKEILATHGIDIDEKKKVMTIKPLTARVDIRYELKDDELKILAADNWRAKGNLEKRLDVINKIIGKDFNEKITRQMLNEDKNYVNLTYAPGAKEYYEKKFINFDKQQALNARITEIRRSIAMDNDEIERDEAAVNGHNIEKLLPGKAFFANQTNGRQLLVGEVRVDRVIDNKAYDDAVALHDLVKRYGITKDMDKTSLATVLERIKQDRQIYADNNNSSKALENLEQQVQAKVEGKKGHIEGLEEPKKEDYKSKERYTMTAVINGRVETRDITEKQYRKFMDLSDASRLKYFAGIFSDKVDLYKADYVFKNDVIISDDKTKVTRESDAVMAYVNSQSVDPALLKEFKANKGWYAEKGDRQKDVRDIRVMPDPIHEGKYKITAVIDTKSVSYEMSAKDYDKFMKSNDLGRMKIFSKISPEVEIKTDPDKKITPGRVLALVGKSVAALAMGPAYWDPDYDRRQYVDYGYNRYRPGIDRVRPVFAENNDNRAAADAQVAKVLPTVTRYEMAMSSDQSNEQKQEQSQGRGMG